MRYPPLGPKGTSYGPRDPAAPWDQVRIAGVLLPGHATVKKASIKLKVDEKKKTGSDGSFPTFHGMHAQHVDVEVIVWTDDQLARLDELLGQWLFRPGVPSAPMTIDSPWLRNLQCVSMIKLFEAHSLQPATDYGVQGRKQVISGLHWFIPKAGATKTDKTGRRQIKITDHRGPAAQPNKPPTQQPNFCGPGG